MVNFTSNTYQMKRKILTFTNKISRHLSKPEKKIYCRYHLWHSGFRELPDEPVIHIDDSDVVKPDGYKFESLGIVRDGSESTSTKMFTKKGYQSVNTITFQAMEQGAALFGRATFWLPNCATVGKVRSEQISFSKAKTMKHTFPMSKYRSPHPKKTFIWYLFTASQSIQ